MGGRAGGGSRYTSRRNLYRQEFDRAISGYIKDIERAIKDVTSGGKYANNAANFLKAEVLKDATNTAAIAQAKQMIKSNSSAYYLLQQEHNAIQKGASAAAALKMKSKINKALQAHKKIDYVAQAGISDADVLKIMRAAKTRVNPSEKQKAAQAKRKAANDAAFNEVFNMLASGRFRPLPKK